MLPLEKDCIAVHLLSRQSLEGDTLDLASMSDEWVSKNLTAKKIHLHGRVDKDHGYARGNVILTSSTEDLRKFAKKFGGSDELYPADNNMHFRRVKP